MQYIRLIVVLIIALLSCSKEGSGMPIKKDISYRYANLIDHNSWLKVTNAAGLSFVDAQSIYMLGVSGFLTDGEMVKLNEANRVSGYGIAAYSFQRLENVILRGGLYYKVDDAQDLAWTYSINSRSSAFAVSDSIAGDFRKEVYGLYGDIACNIRSNVALGLGFNFKSGTSAKDVDPRNRNTLMKLSLRPGMVYTMGRLRIGLNGLYYRDVENIAVKVFGSGKTVSVFDHWGLGFYSKHTLTRNGTLMRDFYHVGLGGSMQLEFLGEKGRFLNEIRYLKNQEEIFRDRSGVDRGGESETVALEYLGNHLYRGSKYSFITDIALKLQNRYGYENIQRAEIIEQVSQIIQYGTRLRNQDIQYEGDLSWKMLRNIGDEMYSWSMKLGVTGAINRSKFIVSPHDFDETLYHVEPYWGCRFPMLFNRSRLDFNLRGSYQIGWGDMFSREDEDGELIELETTSLMHHTEEQEYSFLYNVADKMNIHGGVTYAHKVNSSVDHEIYVNLNYKNSFIIEKDIILDHLQNLNRWSFSLQLGYIF